MCYGRTIDERYTRALHAIHWHVPFLRTASCSSSRSAITATQCSDADIMSSSPLSQPGRGCDARVLPRRHITAGLAAAAAAAAALCDTASP